MESNLNLSSQHLALDTLQMVEDLVISLLPDVLAMRETVTRKPDGSPVTKADVLIETSIEHLLRTQLPNVNFCGEESFFAHEQSESGWLAVLDPIDGTENFCSGSKLWGVSLSIWRDSAHVASLILLPELGERLRTGEKIQYATSRISGFSSSLAPELIEELGLSEEARITGCAVYNLANVVRGTFASFTNPVGAYSWDLLAGLNLALEHGCEVTVNDQSYDGTYLQPGTRFRVRIRHRPNSHFGEGSVR